MNISLEVRDKGRIKERACREVVFVSESRPNQLSFVQRLSDLWRVRLSEILFTYFGPNVDSLKQPL